MGTPGSQTTWHGNGDWMIDLKGHEFGGRDVNSLIHIEIGIAASQTAWRLSDGYNVGIKLYGMGWTWGRLDKHSWQVKTLLNKKAG